MIAKMSEPLKKYLQRLDAKGKRDFASKVFTSVNYLHALAGGHRGISKTMGIRLEKASNGKLSAADLCFGYENKSESRRT